MMEGGLLYYSFYFTYLALIGSTFIIILTALAPISDGRRSENKRLIDIIIIETAVNFIASFVYNQFITDFNKGEFDLQKITNFRYLDWYMTTPLLLLSTVIYLDYQNISEDPTLPSMSYVPLVWMIVLDLIMLSFGYLGETGRISRIQGLIFGGLALIGLFIIMYRYYVKSRNSLIFFWIFVTVWSLYGVGYMLNTYWKNIVYNILDFLAKVVFSLYAAFLLLLQR